MITSTQQKQELFRTIWSIADDLRGSVDGWDFKQYILGMLFYRFISENITNYINALQIEAGIEGFDIIIALSDVDADNLVICQMARYYFNVRRQICTAYNPRNVPIFKKLGVSTVISATYIMSKLIEDGPDIEGNAVFHV